MDSATLISIAIVISVMLIVAARGLRYALADAAHLGPALARGGDHTIRVGVPPFF
jgi:hypothetical protein